MVLFNYYKNSKRILKSFFEWAERKKDIVNWFKAWTVSNSKIAKSMSHRHDTIELDNEFIINYCNGMKLIFNQDQYSDMGGLIDNYQNYFRKLNYIPENNDIIIDIGAHIGSFSIPLCWNHRGAIVYAFEPDKKNFQNLKNNKILNNLDDSKLIISNTAIAGKDGIRKLMIGPTSTTSTMDNVNYIKNKKYHLRTSIYVNSITLNKLIENINCDKINLLKMDCEGCEYEVILNTSVKHLKKINRIFLEMHPIDGKSPSLIIEYLKNVNFDIVDYYEIGNGCIEIAAVSKVDNNEKYYT